MRDGDVTEVVLKSCVFKCVGEKKTPLCEFTAETESGEMIPVNIWMSAKAMGIARGQFKKLGFPIDTRDISDLPKFLSSGERRVMVTIESREYKGSIQYEGKIDAGGGNSLSANELSSLTKAMRAAKKDGEENAPASTSSQKPKDTFSQQDIAKAKAAGVGKEPDVDLDSIPF